MILKAFNLMLSVFCVGVFAIQWFKGELVQAWVPLVWCSMVAINDLKEYMGS